jgi:hypothetical protein
MLTHPKMLKENLIKGANKNRLVRKIRLPIDMKKK